MLRRQSCPRLCPSIPHPGPPPKHACNFERNCGGAGSHGCRPPTNGGGHRPSLEAAPLRADSETTHAAPSPPPLAHACGRRHSALPQAGLLPHAAAAGAAAGAADCCCIPCSKQQKLTRAGNGPSEARKAPSHLAPSHPSHPGGDEFIETSKTTTWHPPLLPARTMTGEPWPPSSNLVV